MGVDVYGAGAFSSECDIILYMIYSVNRLQKWM